MIEFGMVQVSRLNILHVAFLALLLSVLPFSRVQASTQSSTALDKTSNKDPGLGCPYPPDCKKSPGCCTDNSGKSN